MYITIITLSLLTFTSCDSDDDSDNTPETPFIDLKADAITFSVEPTSQFEGYATITGSIVNIGDNFSSGTGQQIISLYERSLGTPTNQPGDLVASLDFTSLAAGEKLEVSYTRTWNSSSPAEGEFAPEYILRIDYDPDLLLDSNVHNNDSNNTNDSILVSGHIINSMF